VSIDVHVNTTHTDVAFLFLMTITEPSSGTVFRVVNNLEDVASNGETFSAFPFDITLPPDDGGTPQSMKVTTFNASRDLIEILRGTLEPPEVKVELITSNNPDDIHKRIDFLRVAGVEYDALNVSFNLVATSAFARQTQRHTYNQAEFPGLFYALQ
jgi:hypothetical protein